MSSLPNLHVLGLLQALMVTDTANGYGYGKSRFCFPEMRSRASESINVLAHFEIAMILNLAAQNVPIS